jgi:hypothetical protein
VAKKASAACKCVDQVNAKLAESGVKVTQHMRVNFTTGKGDMSGPCVEVHRFDKSKRARIPVVPCAYCPFCGKAID